MSEFTPKQIDDFFSFWNQHVVQSVPKTPPPPLGYSQLCDRLGLPSGTHISPQSLKSMANAVLALPPETEDIRHIEASYLWLVKKNAPWAIKKRP